MLQLSEQFFNKFKWRHETINGKSVYTIRDKSLCNDFWMALWHHVLASAFRSQQMITELDSVDLNEPVIVDDGTLNLLSAQKSLESINYYANMQAQNILTSKPFYQLNVTSSFIFSCYLFVSLLLVMWNTRKQIYSIIGPVIKSTPPPNI